MSHAIIVNSTADDSVKISDTIDILNFVRSIISRVDLSIPNTDSFSADRIDSLISWYNSMYTILTDPSIFFSTPEELE